MSELREELIQAITIVATTTNMTVQECIDEAVKILRTEQRKYRKHQINNLTKSMFRSW
jgi:hypothetical protein